MCWSLFSSKTIIRFGFCDTQNDQGLGKCYHRQTTLPVCLSDAMVCFREGRTETVRPCTMEACAFVRSMRNPAATVCKFSSIFISLFEPKPGFSQLIARKKGALDEDTRVSLARPVLSSAHYFQAPVEVANKTLFESYSRAKIRFTVFCFFIASPTAMILVIHVLRRFFFL